MSLQSQRKSNTQRSKHQLPPFISAGDWIGPELPQAPPSPEQRKKQNQTVSRDQRELRSTAERPMAVGSKSPVQLMQDILRMVGEGQENWLYYSKEAEESLGELLTNKFKLSSFVKKLEGEMVGLDAEVVKNYEILVLLLGQLSGADVEVRQGPGGLDIRFNRGLIERQQAEIERLEKEKEEREKQIRFIIEEYESIIFNFNDVIERLVNKQDAVRLKSKF